MRSELATVIVPKSGITEGKGRNNLAGLLESAGYDRVRDGLDRQDTFTQGGIRFRGIKDAPTLASQFRNAREGMGVIMGLDVLMEADLLARREGIRCDIRTVLDLGIGNCSMYVLAPEEAPVSAPEDLADRTVFTKYPAVFRQFLSAWKQGAKTEYVTGAEIRANENRDKNVAAFEIVESGGSARDNGLMIARNLPYPSGTDIGISYAERPMAISTNLYGANINWMSHAQRQKVTELGLALESSLRRNTFVSFEFMVSADRADSFNAFGMKGPTVSVVQSNDGQDWRSIKICVPQDDMNAVRLRLINQGAQGIVTTTGLLAEPDPKDSQVLKAMLAPAITLSREESLPVSEAEFLVFLCDFLGERISSNDPNSATVKAFNKGPEFCAAKCSEEVLELSQSLLDADAKNAIAEAGDVLFRFLIALRSRRTNIRQIAPTLSSGRTSTEYLAQLVSGIESGVGEPSQILALMQARWNACSTDLRKKDIEDVLSSATEFLRAFAWTLSAYDIKLQDVIDELQKRHKPNVTK